MISRFLEKKVEIEGREIETQVNCLELEYYLVESVGSDCTEAEDTREYGVEIVEKELDRVVDSKMFKNIYSCRSKVQDLIEILARNSVTPVSLPYVLDDMIGIE